MSITIKGVTSGGVDLKAPDTGSNTTVTLPSATGTLLPTDGNGSALTNLTSANLVGALPALDGSALTGVGVSGIVSTANATAITIDSLERVGIGTTSPDTLVHIKASSGATLKVEETGGSYGELSAGGSGLHINAKTGGYITLRPNGGTEALRVTSDGRGLSQFTAKAWVNFNGTGTVAIRDSHNVSSITDNSTGNYTANFTNNMANSDYARVGNAGYSGTAVTSGNADVATVSSIRMLVFWPSGAIADGQYLDIIVFGD